MKLEEIKVSMCYESETNPRGADFEDASFKELVASVKEKGVLVPVLVRVTGGKTGDEVYEVIAGNRRFRAAKQVGLDVIPAQVVQMTDDEAAEAAIVENLQRADVHPLEEGEAYRKLIEDGGRTAKDIAVKVGKSESYVRQRLFLTNLSPKLAKLYRKGTMPDAHAAVIARLSVKDQDQLLEKNEYLVTRRSAKELEQFIKEHVYKPLAYQPWVNDPDVAKIVGPCKECPPNRAALFGDVKEGVCTDLRCWSRKMEMYLTHRIKQEKLVPIVKQYGAPDRKSVGGRSVLSESQYKGLSTQTKKHCSHAEKAIVVDGPDTSSTMWICSSSECKQHHAEFSEYEQTPAERKKRKAQIARQRAKEATEYEAYVKTVAKKVKWPLSEKALNVLIENALDHHGVTSLGTIAKRLDIKLSKERVGSGQYAYSRSSYKPGLRTWLGNQDTSTKLRTLFEISVSKENLKSL